MIQQQPTNLKVDICFGEAVTKTRSYLACLNLFYLFRGVVMIVSSSIAKNDAFVFGNYYMVFLLIGGIQSLLNLFPNLHRRFKYLNNKDFLINVAMDCHHTLYQPEYTQAPTNDLPISKTVFSQPQNLNAENLSEEQKNRCIDSAKDSLEASILHDSRLIRLCNAVLSLLSVIAFVLGLISTADVALGESFWYKILECFLISEFILRAQIYFIVLVVLISPLIFVGLCVRHFTNRPKKAVLPASEKATVQLIQEVGQCAICIQTIQLDEEIIPMPCSRKHSLHKVCVVAWTKVNPSCPICRHPLTA